MGQKSGKLTKQQTQSLRQDVSFSEDEIQDWWQEFIRSAKVSSGSKPFLTQKEFIEVYNTVYPGNGEEYAKHIFRTFDKNGDGRVDFREFLLGLSITSSLEEEKKLRWAFQLYDINQSGFISKDEIIEILQAIFKMNGLNQSSTKSAGLGTPEELASSLFEVMETDGDNSISWSEFRSGATRCSLIVDLLQCSPGSEFEAVLKQHSK
ncbi:hypothetical protein C0Q70_16010 [Pomacea canaliculata]|uniref:EF-hand domain-containing protein n=1 Tax=Pomacea canaliculata TaxID=400727 RepID=A0A2T7NNL2_POMCA|nr:neurocalcin-delta-like [Pomacea canaliculata]PVD22754.1 hypothetical protein C0Q70_16010 [Pomacea canaliculata]